MAFELGRRQFLIGTGAALIAAPAIVRATSIMKVRSLPTGETSLASLFELALVHGVMSVNELRRLEGLPPLDYSASIHRIAEKFGIPAHPIPASPSQSLFPTAIERKSHGDYQA